jgi:crotonobetainyl-CoA:carnitine CoA-transferase CaiB-like acyl-CoA transferase
MGDKEKTDAMLSPYRVLDLTDEKGLFCGKLLGDLGADVIKIERPGGDPARNIGPFYHDEVDPEKSLFWFAFNTSKRGITLDIKTADGQEIFKKLVEDADFVIESFPPGYMDELGLGYSALEKINPRVIMVSITPFGQTGPHKDYKAPDIVAWAMGGHMYPCGSPDHPPVRISHHSQAYIHAATEAVVGAMMALYYREMTGEGQQVDVSIQESLAQSTYTNTSTWDMVRVNRQREGGLNVSRAGVDTGIRLKRVWPCKDGYVMWFFLGGARWRRNPPLVEWMNSEGMATDFLKKFDWEAFGWGETTQEIIDRLEEPAAKFFLRHTRAELWEGAVKHRVMVYPVATTDDIVQSIQLADRGFWVELEHPELGTTITYPGAFTKTSEAPPKISRCAPLIGEHNQQIYAKESGFSGEEILTLQQAKVI